MPWCSTLGQVTCKNGSGTDPDPKNEPPHDRKYRGRERQHRRDNIRPNQY